MWGDYLRSFWLGVRHNKVNTLINISGLALGLAVFFALILYVHREFSWDDQWENADRIYQLAGALESPGGNSAPVLTNAPWVLGTTLQTRNPEAFGAYARVFQQRGMVTIDGKDYAGQEANFAEPALLDLFQLETVEGSLQEVFADPGAIAVSTDVVETLLGDASPLGKTLGVSTPQGASADYVVKAIYHLPEPTSVNLGGFLGLLDVAAPPVPGVGVDFWIQSPAQQQELFVAHYFKLHEGIDGAVPEADLRAFMDENKYIDFGSYKLRYSFRRLQDTHLRYGAAEPVDSSKRLQIYAAIGVLVLLISGCNFVMLATLRSVDRMREVGIRKTIGSKATQLMRQYLMDAFCQTLLAAVFAMSLLELGLPRLQSMLNLPPQLDLVTWRSMGFGLVIVALFTLLCGVYPALLMARGKPVSLLRSSSGNVLATGSRLRKLLVSIQFAVVIMLLLASAVVQQQIEYTRSRGPGFSMEDVVTLGTRDTDTIAKAQTLADEFAKLPGVLAAAAGGSSPGTQGFARDVVKTVMEDGDVTEAMIQPSSAGADYFRVHSTPVLAGREFTREHEAAGTVQNTVVLNKSAVDALGFATTDQALGSVIKVPTRSADGMTSSRNLNVVGVVADMQMTSVLVPPVPQYYQFNTISGLINVKIHAQADRAAVVEAMQQVWRDITGAPPFANSSWDLYLTNQLRREEFEARILTGNSMLAMVIALLGLYGLVAATVLKRVKEIGVRKAMGAGGASIVALLLWQFSKPIVVANLVAWPLGYWAITQWLQRFPYRLDTGVILGTGLAASVVALCIAWVTVGVLAAKAASAKPVLALRYE